MNRDHLPAEASSVFENVARQQEETLAVLRHQSLENIEPPFVEHVAYSLAYDEEIPPGFYPESILVDAVLDNYDDLHKRRDRAAMTASLRVVAADGTCLLPMNAKRMYVLPRDEEARQQTLQVAQAASIVVQHLHGPQPDEETKYPDSLSFATCYEYAMQYNLLPDDEQNQNLFETFVSSHLQVTPTEDGMGIAAIVPVHMLQPQTVGDVLDRIYRDLQEVGVRTADSIINAHVLQATLTEDSKQAIARAMRCDPRMGYLGSNGKATYYMPLADMLPDHQGIHEAMLAVHTLGDILAMRGLYDPDTLREEEAIIIAQREGLLGDEVTAAQRLLIQSLLHMHPAIKNRDASDRTMPHKLSDYADAYWTEILFGHIPRERQELWWHTAVDLGDRLALEGKSGLTRDELMEAFTAVKKVEIEEYRFIEMCLIPRLQLWRPEGLEEYASVRRLRAQRVRNARKKRHAAARARDAGLQ